MSRTFDAVDDVISMGSPAFLDNMLGADFTVAAWINATTVGEAGSAGRIIQKRGSETIGGWLFNTQATATIAFSTVKAAGTIEATSSGAANSIVLGRWHFVTAVYTSADFLIKLYVDGNEVSYATQTAGAAAPGTDAAGNFLVGNNIAGARTFDGSMSHIQIFKRALSNNEIRQIMRYPGSINRSSAGYWPFWGGATEKDYSGNENTGTVTGALFSTNNPPVNRVFGAKRPNVQSYFFTPAAAVTPTPGVPSRSYNGSTSKLDCGSSSRFDNLINVTVAAWIKPTTAGESSIGRIMHKGNAIINEGWRFYVDSTVLNSNTLSFRQDFSGTPTIRTTDNEAIKLGQWNHVALTFVSDGLAASSHIYVNGVEATYQLSVNAGGSITNDAAFNLFIGNSNDQDATFDGQIAHVQIFNNILTVNQIREIMHLPGSLRYIVTPGTVGEMIGYWPHWGTSSTTELDYSGYTNHGTATDLTNGADGPPIHGIFKKRKPRTDYALFLSQAQAAVGANDLSSYIFMG